MSKRGPRIDAPSDPNASPTDEEALTQARFESVVRDPRTKSLVKCLTNHIAEHNLTFVHGAEAAAHTGSFVILKSFRSVPHGDVAFHEVEKVELEVRMAISNALKEYAEKRDPAEGSTTSVGILLGTMIASAQIAAEIRTAGLISREVESKDPVHPADPRPTIRPTFRPTKEGTQSFSPESDLKPEELRGFEEYIDRRRARLREDPEVMERSERILGLLGDGTTTMPKALQVATTVLSRMAFETIDAEPNEPIERNYDRIQSHFDAFLELLNDHLIKEKKAGRTANSSEILTALAEVLLEYSISIRAVADYVDEKRGGTPP